MWGEKATHMAAPVTSLLNEAAARSVDSTVTYRKQQGVPRESPRFCEKRRRKQRRTGLPTPRPVTVVVTGAGVPAPGRETQKDTTPRRGPAATSAIAKGQSAEGIVDEKSVGKIPHRRDRRKPER
jgi:hypothetical protein